MRSAKTFITWWALCAGLWLLLDDTTALPELIDGAVAAAIGAGAATAATAAAAGPMVGPPRGWARRGWRPWAALLRDLPSLVGVLARAVFAGQRDPGRLRAVAFRPAEEPGERAGQSALAAVAGSLAPGAVVVAVDPRHERILVHELVPRSGRESADPLELG